jgi:hypothetical protein
LRCIIKNRYFGVASGASGPPPDTSLGDRREATQPVLADPPLLLADDVHHRALDEDRVRGAVDLGLLVAQPGHERVLVVGLVRQGRDRLDRIEVHHQDLVDPPAGEHRQQVAAHRLRVTEPGDLHLLVSDEHRLGLVARHPDDVEVLDDPGQHVRLDVVAGPDRRPSPDEVVAVAPEAGVRVAQLQPARLVEQLGGLAAVVGHERVEAPDDRLQPPEPAVRERGAVAPRAELAQEREVAQRDAAQLAVGLAA